MDSPPHYVSPFAKLPVVVQFGRMYRRRQSESVAFARCVQEQFEPVERVMDACGAAHIEGI